MSHNILVTGASGYLGGSLLANWKDANLPEYDKLYALIRSEAQIDAVKQHAAEPLILNLDDHDKLRDSIIRNEISIILFLVDSRTDKHQPTMIQALKEVKKQTGREVHFIHTAGAKHFSSHAGLPTDKPLLDTDPNLYNLLKTSVSPFPYFAETTRANLTVIDECEKHGVRGYIFAPCIVYGEGEGFGNRISIQDVAIVKVARKVRRVYDVNEDDPTWPVCHISDNSRLYLEMVRNMLRGTEIGYNKSGFYLAASGSVAWSDVYHAFAVALAKRGVVDDEAVQRPDDEALAQMGEGLEIPPILVPVMLGGKCTFTAVRGAELGWKPRYSPQHILEVADSEVELILKNVEK